ncbi:hypothetical protein KDA_13460 [Dictyobacter alpinus]|uniref:1,4-dihydroxy-2-naphthoate octaprenyltransferase n=1 Tax=Dictyobacter alpinus TaxID=2014873 RepID=A0A402B3D4_9CHLR|nr:UbiA family prenyltransferase [Dictyobacter alpinus]GCE25862.1 hypothetical protein KDA_13460 [Dictyobacter alpinus]
MGALKQQQPGSKIPGFFFLCHPGPVLFHTLAVSIFALLAAWPHLVWGTLFLIIAAHLAMQCSIAVLNDYCDRELDSVSKRDKPLARGIVSPREALIFGWAWIVLMYLLLLPLNWLAILISTLYLLLGQSYNLGLKSTPWSGIVFAVAIPLIPVYAYVAVGNMTPFIFCLIPVAALLGVALNLANSLPDIAEDAANHARTLAVVLGERRTRFICPLLILLAALLVACFALTNIVHVQSILLWATLGLVIIGSGLIIFQSTSLNTPGGGKRYFLLVVGTCLVLASGWLASTLLV